MLCVIKFIKKIIKNNDYVIINKIEPIPELFNNEKSDDLENFCHNYNRNHIICLKIKENNKETFSDDESDGPENIPNFGDPNDGVVVGNDFANNILKKKYIFTKTKNWNFNKIRISLIYFGEIN